MSINMQSYKSHFDAEYFHFINTRPKIHFHKTKSTYADKMTIKSSQFQASRRYVYEYMKNPLAISLIIISMV